MEKSNAGTWRVCPLHGLVLDDELKCPDCPAPRSGWLVADAYGRVVAAVGLDAEEAVLWFGPGLAT
jgi:hypothetical protein